MAGSRHGNRGRHPGKDRSSRPEHPTGQRWPDAALISGSCRSGPEIPEQPVIPGPVRVRPNAVGLQQEAFPAGPVVPFGAPGRDREIRPASSATPSSPRSTCPDQRPSSVSRVFGAQLSPWQTTSRSTGGMSASSSSARPMPSGWWSSCQPAGSISPWPARRRTSASRPAAIQENGHAATGSASCIARRPAPMAVTAVAGSAFHRSATAHSPGSAAVTIHDPPSSAPWPSSRGTGVNETAQDSRAASAARSIPLAAGDHLTKQRSAPAPTSKVRPPSLSFRRS